MTGILWLSCASPAPDADGDGVWDPLDCAPSDASVSPREFERCNGLDDDCDGLVDEPWDHDGDLATAGASCPGPRDCDDDDPSRSPWGFEACNGRDDDCNGVVDDDADQDHDGWFACAECDDRDPSVHPGANETCDGRDEDCTGLADEPFDGDGDGASPCDGDCDDADPFVSGHLPEVCDGRDNDCDEEVDEGVDQDGDGVLPCRGDCDDADPEAFPGASERCNGRDDDCDPETDERVDADGDGFSACDGDCDDQNPSASPAGIEACGDGWDNDCSGHADDDPGCWGCVDTGASWVCTAAVSWEQARDACFGLGATLADPVDAVAHVDLAGAAAAVTGGPVWIGATDSVAEGTWLWPDGSTPSFTAWASGQPDDAGGAEDCAATNYDGPATWNDYPCGTGLPFVCLR